MDKDGGQTGVPQEPLAETRPQPEGGQLSRLRTFGAAIGALLLYALLVDAAVETYLSGSPVRWIVVGTVAAYSILTVLLWKRLRWGIKAAFSLLVLLGLLAVTTWLPEGLIRGVTLARVSTASVLAAISALAILVSVIVLVRLKFVPLPAKILIGFLGVYGVAAFLLGIAGAVPYQDLFHGRSLWERLPFWLQGAFVGVVSLVPIALVAVVINGSLTRRSPARVWVPRAAALGLVVVMVTAGLRTGPGIALEDLTPQQVAKIRQHLESLIDPGNLPEVFGTLKTLSEKIPQDAFDLDAAAAALGSDVEKLFSFVRDKVRYEAYEGVLRGPRGTLIAMAGNAFDKALLLGALLGHHGIEVRYVRGRLTREAAVTLVERIAPIAAHRQAARPSPPTPAVPFGAAVSSFVVDVVAHATSHQRMVERLLNEGRLQLTGGGVVTKDGLVAEATDHLWVEYERGDEWIPLDPTSLGARPGVAYAQSEQVWDTLPLQVFHRFLIRLIADDLVGTQVHAREVLRYEATVPAIGGTIVGLRHDVTRGSAGWIATPVLQVGSQVIRGAEFGTTRDDGSTTGEITALRLHFDFFYPGGRTESVARGIFDRRDSVRESQALAGLLRPVPELDGVPLALYDLVAMSIGSTFVHPAQLAARLLGSFQDVQPFATALSKPAERELSVDEARQFIQELKAVPLELVGWVAQAFQIHSGQALDYILRESRVWFYESTPKLVISHVGLAAVGKEGFSPTGALDLRRDVLRGVAAQQPLELIAKVNFMRSLLDAAIERAMFAYLGRFALRTDKSTMAIMEQAQIHGIPIQVLKEIPDGIRARLAPTGGGVVAVVAPVHAVPVGPEERLGWWQINLDTGDIVGTMDTGLNQGGVEYRTFWDKPLGMTLEITAFVLSLPGIIFMAALLVQAMFLGLVCIIDACWNERPFVPSGGGVRG